MKAALHVAIVLLIAAHTVAAVLVAYGLYWVAWWLTRL